jgi:hypothetical protein
VMDTAYLTSKDCYIISCGMLNPELAHPRDSSFLNPRQLLFKPPGLHSLPNKLELHLLVPALKKGGRNASDLCC